MKIRIDFDLNDEYFVFDGKINPQQFADFLDGVATTIWNHAKEFPFELRNEKDNCGYIVTILEE